MLHGCWNPCADLDVSTGAIGTSIEVVLMVDTLFTMTDALTGRTIGVDCDDFCRTISSILAAADVNVLATVISALEYNMLSSLKESVLSFCTLFRCWPMAMLDCNRPSQACNPADHL